MSTSKQFKQIIKEVRALPQSKETYNKDGYAMFEVRYFHIRIFNNSDDVSIQFAEKKTFDRWSNSVNFFTERSKGRKHYYPVLLPQYKWAIKVLKSKLFDFNSYFNRIELPWFETKRNS
jgi:hypothetical protein